MFVEYSTISTVALTSGKIFYRINKLINILSFDFLPDLKNFQWSNPLILLGNKCTEKRGNKYTNAFLAHDSYIRYILAIWFRYVLELEQYMNYRKQWNDSRNRSPGIYEMSPEDWELYHHQNVLMTQLQLDYESFIIFARILMDKSVAIAKLLLDDNRIPIKSFNDHKDFFLRPSNIPYHLNDEYGRLVREQTDWFDNCLKPTRDKVMVHSNVPWTGTHESSEGGIQFMRTNILSGQSLELEHERMINLKHRYRPIYPELDKIDTLWEIIEFFMNHNVKLEPEDAGKLYQTIEKTGANLPSLKFIASNILDFQKSFAEIFESSV